MLFEGSNTQSQGMMRLPCIAYIQLWNLFKQDGWLENSRYSTVEEKMATFLYVISHNDHFIKVKHRSQHYTQTIYKYFNEEMDGMKEF